MKLLDILARELKDCPDQYYQIYQDSGGHLTGTLSNSDLEDCDQEDLPFDPVSIAWGGNNAVVDRAEWQAAVDALKSDKCEHSYGNKIGCPECGELNAPKVAEWDGTGSPVPGSSIEYSIGDGWYPCEVRYVLNRDDSPGIALVAWCEHLGKDQYLSNDRDHKFRTSRTAEQVAAEEREKAAEALYMAVMDHKTRFWPTLQDHRKEHYRRLVDAGWQKVEP